MDSVNLSVSATDTSRTTSPLASLTALEPMTNYSPLSGSSFSSVPIPPFNWNPDPLAKTQIWNIHNVKPTQEGIPLPPSPIYQTLETPEIQQCHVQASLLPPLGSPGLLSVGSPDSPGLISVGSPGSPGLISVGSPGSPFSCDHSCTENSSSDATSPEPSNVGAIPLKKTKSKPASRNNAKKVGPAKRIGRPPGSFKRPIKVPAAKLKEKNDGEPKVCRWNHCNESFTDKKAFYDHVKAHLLASPYKEYKCLWEGCDRPAYCLLYQIFVHVRAHTKEKPHHCPWAGCTKAYSRAENLKTHVRHHTGEKPYPCKKEGCDKRFTNASDCSKHMNRVHSDAKPYECLYPGCTKRYTDPSSLRKHIISNHDDDYEEKTAHLPKPIRPRRRRNVPARTPTPAEDSQQQKVLDVVPVESNPPPVYIPPQAVFGHPPMYNPNGFQVPQLYNMPLAPVLAQALAPAPVPQFPMMPNQAIVPAVQQPNPDLILRWLALYQNRTELYSQFGMRYTPPLEQVIQLSQYVTGFAYPQIPIHF